MYKLYYDLGLYIKRLERIVDHVKNTYASLRGASYYEFSDPENALRELDATIFTGTNVENSGLGVVMYLTQDPMVTHFVRRYLQNTNKDLVFDVQGLTFTDNNNNGLRVNAYNPSEAMDYNVWNLFGNFDCEKFPSCLWLIIAYFILQTNGGKLSREAIQVLIMGLFDDCTKTRSDNIISKLLRTEYAKGNTTVLQSELLYKFLESAGIKYDLYLAHCMGKPSSETDKQFTEKVTSFVGKYIAPDKREPFHRRISEIGFTQTLGSQENIPSTIEYYDVKVYAVDDAVETLSQTTQEVLTQMTQEVSIQIESLSQGLQTNSNQSVTGGGSYDGDGSLSFDQKYLETGKDDKLDYYSDDGSVNSQDSIPLGQPERNKYCYAFLRGECPRGSMCPYSHSKENTNKSGGGSGVCSAFQRGYCERGDDCRFSHKGGSIRTTKRKRTNKKRINKKRTNKKRINKKRTPKKVKNVYKKTRNRK
jgi:hypothetical protein